MNAELNWRRVVAEVAEWARGRQRLDDAAAEQGGEEFCDVASLLEALLEDKGITSGPAGEFQTRLAALEKALAARRPNADRIAKARERLIAYHDETAEALYETQRELWALQCEREGGEPMKFDHAKCPQCGAGPNGILEHVFGTALLAVQKDGSFDYAGETKIEWDSQETHKTPEGLVVLTCGEHEWLAKMSEPPADYAADNATKDG